MGLLALWSPHGVKPGRVTSQLQSAQVCSNVLYASCSPYMVARVHQKHVSGAHNSSTRILRMMQHDFD
jgi:hypothetical protein